MGRAKSLTHNLCGRIFRYAVAHRACEREPSPDIELREVLTPTIVRHHSSLTDPKDVGALLQAIDEFRGSFNTKTPLRLAPLVFVRPGERLGYTEEETTGHGFRSLASTFLHELGFRT